MSNWDIGDIQWDEFRPDLVDPQIVMLLKATSIVEQNIDVPEAYLRNVFGDDEALIEVVDVWSRGEKLHGTALATWVALCDPSFDFDACFERFMEKFEIPLDTAHSVRGSRTGELISRCVVEAGTSSFYWALRDVTDEPVLRDLLNRIAQDEIHHYKAFQQYIAKYSAAEKVGLWKRLSVAIKRIQESEDDELAYAFYVTNDVSEVYDRKRSIESCKSIAYRFYQPTHIRRCVTLILNAIGLPAHGELARLCADIAFRRIQRRSERSLPGHVA